MTDPIEQQLRKELEQLFFVPVHIDHQNVVPDSITIVNNGKDYYIGKIIELFDTYAARRAGLGASEKLALLDRIENEVLNVGDHGLISLREEQWKALAKLRAEQKETE